MKNEVLKAEVLNDEISVIEQNHHNAILSIHENMQQLVNDCVAIEVHEDDKNSYDNALELKRVVKATHVAIEKKRKELKQPLIDYGKRLDKWVEEIYQPLVNAEKIVKKKMEVYEAKQERLKQERKLADEKQKQEEVEMELRLKDLNGQLQKITTAKSKSEIEEIEKYLDGIDLNDFGVKSAEAGFILNQLKLTCSMAYRAMKDEEEIPVEPSNLETTPITDDLVEDIKSFPSPKNSNTLFLNEEDSDNNESPVEEELYELPPSDLLESNVIEVAEIDSDSKIENELQKIELTDEEMIIYIQDVSDSYVQDVKDFLAKQFEQFMKLKYVKLDSIPKEHYEFMQSEIIKRVGALLSK